MKAPPSCFSKLATRLLIFSFVLCLAASKCFSLEHMVTLALDAGELKQWVASNQFKINATENTNNNRIDFTISYPVDLPRKTYKVTAKATEILWQAYLKIYKDAEYMASVDIASDAHTTKTSGINRFYGFSISKSCLAGSELVFSLSSLPGPDMIFIGAGTYYKVRVNDLYPIVLETR
jgi:hypothetical protein